MKHCQVIISWLHQYGDQTVNGLVCKVGAYTPGIRLTVKRTLLRSVTTF